MARELVVAPLTVKKAYDHLQAEGLIVMVQGRGTFVTQKAEAQGAQARGELDTRLDCLVRQARLMGVSMKRVQAMIIRGWGKGGRHGQSSR